jgi:hypothetical protein
MAVSLSVNVRNRRKGRTTIPIAKARKPPISAVRHSCREGQLWVKGGYRGRVDGRAGLPSAAEMPFALEQLRLVPEAEIGTGPLLSYY